MKETILIFVLAVLTAAWVSASYGQIEGIGVKTIMYPSSVILKINGDNGRIINIPIDPGMTYHIKVPESTWLITIEIPEHGEEWEEITPDIEPEIPETNGRP